MIAYFFGTLVTGVFGIRMRLLDPIQTSLNPISPQTITTEDESQYPTINADGSVSGPTTPSPGDGTDAFTSGTSDDYKIIPSIAPSISADGFDVNVEIDLCQAGSGKCSFPCNCTAH